MSLNATTIRFWSKVNKLGPMPKKYTKVKTRCWIWTASLQSGGYGQFKADNDQLVLAHRFAYELTHGKGSLGKLDGCHKCDNHTCVRPSHLFKGTAIDNANDMIAKGRSWRPKGILHGNTNLTEKDVLAIRTLYKTGKYTQKSLHLRFGTKSVNAIQRIVNRLTWQHI